MYGLPPDVDLSFLRNATLIQACFGENELILNFHPEISMMVAASIRITAPDAAPILIEDARLASAPLVSLVGESISEATGRSEGTLTLMWTNGVRLEIFDSWKEFESYTISHEGGVLVV